MPEVDKETWPLGLIISREELAKLVQLQWKTYGTKLDLLTDDPYKEVEPVEEIEVLMKEPPHYKGKSGG